MGFPIFDADLFHGASAGLAPATSARFRDVPSYLASWTEDIGYLTDKRVLDFGCLSGESTFGVAHFHRPKLVVGMDYDIPPKRVPAALASLGTLPFPENLKFVSYRDQASISTVKFDFIYSWSAFARLHADDLPVVARDLYHALRVGGRLLVQVSPLYHAPEGAIMGHLGIRNWEHLLLSEQAFHDKIVSLPEHSLATCENAWKFYQGLNRLTALQICEVVCEEGFHLLKSYETFSDRSPPAVLLDKFQLKTLQREQVVFLFVKG
jgi:SAM-dependent methyltransferase